MTIASFFRTLVACSAVAAAMLLGFHHGPTMAGEGKYNGRGVEDAIALIRSGEWADRKRGFDIIAMLGPEAVGAQRALLDIAVHHESDIARGQAVRALAEIGAQSAEFIGEVQSGLDSGVDVRKGAACYAAMLIPDIAWHVRPRLEAIAALDVELQLPYRIDALEALANADRKRMTISSAIERALSDQFVEIRRISARIFAESDVRSAVWVEQLRPLLHDSDRETQTYAVAAWARRGGSRRTSEQVLREVMASTDINDRIRAMSMLELLPRGASEDTIRVLLTTLRQGCTREAAASARALARASPDTNATREALVGEMRRRELDPRLVAEIEVSLSLLERVSDVEGAMLIKHLTDGSDWVVLGAAAALLNVRSGGTAVDSSLGHVLSRVGDPELRFLERALAKWVRLGRLSASALRELIKSHDDPIVRYHARRLLAEHYDAD